MNSFINKTGWMIMAALMSILLSPQSVLGEGQKNKAAQKDRAGQWLPDMRIGTVKMPFKGYLSAGV